MLLIFSVACTASLAGAAVYKWVDEKGVTHYGDTIPPEYVNRGNTQLDKSGVEVKKTAPTLTPEQIKAREDELAKKRAAAKEEAEQARKDKVLLDAYSSVHEIEQVKNRNISVIDNVIKGTQRRVDELKTRRQQLDKEKTALDAQQKPLSIIQQRELKAIDSELPVLEKQLEQKNREVETLKAKYDADAKRYREIKAQAK
jgi:chromosome segregation ATPase